MVKVECDGCGSPYTVSEKRIPDAGLKMRCPKCGKTFLVTRDAAGAARPPAVDDADLPAPALQDLPVAAGARPGAPKRAGAPRTAVGPAPAAAPPAPPVHDDLDLPAPTAGGAGRGFADLPAVRGRAGAPAGRPVAAAGPLPTEPDEFDLPIPMSDGGGSIEDGVGLPALPTNRDLPVPRGGKAAPAPALGATMRSLGAPPPPPAKPPIFGRRGTGPSEATAPGGEWGGADGAAGELGGFGELDIGLPPEATARAGGPIAIEADLPGADDDLPSPSEAALPVVSGGNLPTPAQAGLPVPSKGNLPVPAQAGLPVPSKGNLPVPAQAGLPLVSGGNLPVPQPAGLPILSEPPLAAEDELVGLGPKATGRGAPPKKTVPGLGAAAPAAVAGVGLEFGLDEAAAEEGKRPAAKGSSDLQLGPAVSEAYDGPPEEGAPAGREAIGGEYEIDAAQQRKEATGAGVAELEPVGAPAAEEAPLVQIAPKRSKALRIAALGIVVVAIGGGALSLTPLGPYGAYAISDFVNRSKHERSLADERQKAQTQLDEDTASAAKAALEQAKRGSTRMPRFAPMTAYTAYLAFMKSVRFGADSQDKALGKQLMDAVAAKTPGPMLALAHAASDTLDGQLARARQALEGLGDARNDVDAAVLAGEIALSAKTPKPALDLWKQAVTLHKSARTLFGLARAQHASGMFVEAEKTAKEVLQLSANHAGARTLAATVAWRISSHEQDAMKLLEQVTDATGAVARAASSAELAAAYGLLGEIHLERYRMSAAERAFAEALKLEPQSEQALTGNGELFFRAGRFTEAIARFEAVLRVNPDSIDGKIGTAKTWLAQERAKDGKELLQKIVAAGSKDSLAGYWLGRCEEALGNRNGAESAYRRAIKDMPADPRTVSAYVGLANLLTGLGKGDEAAAVLAEASAKLPNNPALCLAKGDMALQAGRLDDAKTEYRKAMELDPENLGPKFKMGIAMRRSREFDQTSRYFEEVSRVDPEYPGLSLEWGLLYEDTGQNERAVQMYSEALKKAPNDLDLKLRVGATQVISGHAKLAVPMLREVLTARPESGEVHHFLGRALLVMHTNLTEALGLLKRATEIDPNRAEYFLYYGWAANEIGRPVEAEAALNRALELDKNLGDVYWQRGVLLQKRGATRDALEELKIALEKKPSRFEAYATMALCYADQSDAASAEAAWRRAIQGSDNVAEWHYRLGKLLDQKGGAEAAKEFARAIELAEMPDAGGTPGWLHDAHFLLAEALRTGDPQKALHHYRRFLELAPSDNAYRPDAERAVASLKAPGQP